jgi:hypothetical protein
MWFGKPNLITVNTNGELAIFHTNVIEVDAFQTTVYLGTSELDVITYPSANHI